MKQPRYIIGIALLGLFVLALLNGCTSAVQICENESRQKLDTCNIDCGEGILSEFCKEKCTIEHKDRIDQCAQK
ncbi:MAG: hypothetical protein WCW13_04105 [archaeon]|jgi:hypothetical protein